jgi:hypothetical protein
MRNTKNIQVVWWCMQVCNKLFCMSHYAIIWGLCLLVIGSSCNQGACTMGMAEEPNTRRAIIADYEVSPAGVALLKQFEGLKKNPSYCLEGQWATASVSHRKHSNYSIPIVSQKRMWKPYCVAALPRVMCQILKGESGYHPIKERLICWSR